MKLSRFFSELSSSYAYEIEDLTYDSGGDNVLKSRLKIKREQFAGLLPMSEFDPVMVAPAFHGGFRFGEKGLSQEIFARLLGAQPGEFPSWEALAQTLEMEPWAGQLVKLALDAPGGEQFMLITAGLEYLQSGHGASAGTKEHKPAALEAEGADADSEDHDEDLGEAGEDYLSEQGFDRRS